jgi:serine/threonine-protein kinase
MSEAIHQLTPGYNFSGRYYISRCIGAGGMGSVYEAVHVETHGRVALKVMLPRLVHRDDMRRRFLQEAQVTARIQSDHIVNVFDAGVDETTGMPFIAMEMLVGEDLDALLTRAGRLQPATVVLLLQQAALALDKTHAMGVVHRDLKPHNLFITRRDDGSPCLKILDFGIAKLIDSTGGSQRTRSAGTPVYMPPEQVRGEGDIGAAADAYALAHIAYTMLVGRPYWETEAIELGLGPFIERVFAGPSEAPTARAAREGVALPPGFDAWFMRAAAPNKQMRILPTSQLVAQLAQLYGISTASAHSVPLPSAPPQGYAGGGGPMPATASGGTVPSHPQGPPLAAVPFTPAAATTGAVVAEHSQTSQQRPLWFLVGAVVVLASIAVGSLVTYRIAIDGDEADRARADDDESRSDERRRKAPTCPFERCKVVDVDRDEPVEALDWAKRATKLAQSLERDAELVMISIGETIKGKVARDSTFSLVFIYRYPRPSGKQGEFSGLQVIVGDEQMMARRSADVQLSPVSLPSCGTQKALKAAFADGMDAKARTTLVYHQTPTASAPHWLVTQTGGGAPVVRMVHGVTCKPFAPY